MLGKHLGILRGRVTGQRILPPPGSAPKVEVSFEISGILSGIAVTMLGTYWSTVRADGSLYGECPNLGVIRTQDGQMATVKGAGVGRVTGKGPAVNFRGAVYFDGGGPKLAWLTQMAVLYEWDVEEDGSAQARFTEWK